jgi:undecaprenyl-diphosphatase
MDHFFSSLRQRIRLAGWQEFGLLLAIGSVTASLWIFVTISEDVAENEHRGIDRRILLAFRTSQDLAVPIGTSWVKDVSLDISSLGSASVLALITFLIGGYLFLERKWAAALLILFAALTGAVLNQPLKEWFNRGRPLIVPHLAEVSNSSFPSGHSMLSSIIYLTLAVILAKTVDKPSTKMYLLTPFGLPMPRMTSRS